jgi:hypothetical protein
MKRNDLEAEAIVHHVGNKLMINAQRVILADEGSQLSEANLVSY